MKNQIPKYFLFVCALGIMGVSCSSSPFSKNTVQYTNPKQIMYCSSEGITDLKPIQSHRSFCVVTSDSNRSFELNKPADFSFSIINDLGETVKDFEIAHEKIMHVILVRKDLQQFQHLHPEFDAGTGTFTLKNVNFTSEGPYRFYFDFTPKGTQMGAHGMPLNVAVYHDITVGDVQKNSSPSLTDESKVKTVDKFKVTLNPLTLVNEQPSEIRMKEEIVSGRETKLHFQVEGKNGQPIEHIQKYLGELGHLVIVKGDTFEYIHAHPTHSSTNVYNRIPFEVNFPEAGKYKMFLEFQYGGKVQRVDYVVNVKEGEMMDMHDRMMEDQGMMGH